MNMRNTLIVLMAACLAGISCTKEPSFAPTSDAMQAKMVRSSAEDHEKGCLLVKFSESAVSEIEAGKEVLAGVPLTSMTPAFSNPRKKEIAKRYGLHQWYKISFDKETPVSEVARSIASDKNVLLIEQNSLIRHSSRLQEADFVTVDPILKSTSATQGALPFNDPMLNQQWHLINTGDQEMVPYSVPGADLAVKDAWRLSTGDTRVIVAVFDMGIMTFHRDLMNVMWTNEVEQNGKFGVDDDNNGYIDDINGYNFYDGKGMLEATGNSSVVSHGTHVAGSIAAQNGNNRGVSSIAGGSGSSVYDGVRLMSCQIFKAGNGLNVGDQAPADMVAAAFMYAADMGACIAQCSFGSKDGYAPESAEYNALLYFTDVDNANCEAVDRNIAVFAAGNYHQDHSLYPGAHPFCISVTAVGPDLLPGGYSNYGTGCDIAAPGGDPYLVAESEVGKDMRTCILSTGVDSSGNSSYNAEGYVYNFGTSMACPQVSGVVALGMSYALKLGKRFTREDFVSRLLTSATDIDSRLTSGSKVFYNSENVFQQFDLSMYKGKMGSGVVDAWKFLIALEGTPTVITQPGKATAIDIHQYAGNSLADMSYELSIDDADRESLGIEEDLELTDGILNITCSKIGSGKIRITGNGFVREISVVSRTSATDNGGWL